jgi:DNA-binding NtrC family response regulator
MLGATQSKRRILLVEPDPVVAAAVEDAAQTIAHVERHRRFESARMQLATTSFDFIVTNLRLGEFNGLHLIYLAHSPSRPGTGLVYTESREPALAWEVQKAGAFYETADRLPVTLAGYLNTSLPPRDRRHPAVPDRRRTFRGGRRLWDERLLREPLGI